MTALLTMLYSSKLSELYKYGLPNFKDIPLQNLRLREDGQGIQFSVYLDSKVKSLNVRWDGDFYENHLHIEFDSLSVHTSEMRPYPQWKIEFIAANISDTASITAYSRTSNFPTHYLDYWKRLYNGKSSTPSVINYDTVNNKQKISAAIPLENILSIASCYSAYGILIHDEKEQSFVNLAWKNNFAFLSFNWSKTS